jgi:hypothetical protein
METGVKTLSSQSVRNRHQRARGALTLCPQLHQLMESTDPLANAVLEATMILDTVQVRLRAAQHGWV